MKSLLYLITIITLLFACSPTTELKNEQPPEKPLVENKTDYIYEATYLDQFKMGNPENVLLVQKMHELILSKQFDEVYGLFSDSVIFRNGDGSTTEGIAAVKEVMETVYSKLTFENYRVGVNLAVTGDNGDEWVLLWDGVDIISPEGKKTSEQYMEAFFIVDGKIALINQFAKPNL
jgi:hypothetical protein